MYLLYEWAAFPRLSWRYARDPYALPQEQLAQDDVRMEYGIENLVEDRLLQ